jgi:ribosomal protein L11 methyltransferase
MSHSQYYPRSAIGELRILRPNYTVDLISLFFERPEREELLIAELWEAGTAGIAEEDRGLRAFFEPPDEGGLLQRFTAWTPSIRREEEIDWERVSRDAWSPILVGERFFLVAPWCGDPTPPGRLRLEMEPGMACGTGRHPATQLCLQALERVVRPGDTVLDVGTGSGIFCEAARLLGAGKIAGCDIDADAIQVARRRLEAPLFVGSGDAVRDEWATVIVANINSFAIEKLAPEFDRVRRPGGALILSGFPEWDMPRGFNPRETLRQEEWICWICAE